MFVIASFTDKMRWGYNTPMNARVPADIEELLRPFLPPGTNFDFELTFRRGGEISRVFGPTSMVARSFAAVSLSGQARNLQIIGRSLMDLVILDPAARDLDDAASIALLGHESYHQWQFDNIPDFRRQYEDAAARTPEDRPWENPFERPAYQAERAIFCDLVGRGVPAGPWIPLGVELWGC